ncbi:MAG TPA: DUF5996 family protein [Thermoleophilia bacterium]|nr:DUF5996 family protein [Thermoleophilia bacterium]
MTPDDAWPALSYEEWAPTLKTLHLHAQMLGKLKLALHPPLPEWLHAGLTLDARGVSTGPLAGDGRVVDAGIDLFDGVLWVRAADRTAVIALTGGRPVAEVWRAFGQALRDLGVAADLWDKPQEMPDETTPLPANEHDRTVDLAHARRLYRVLATVHGLFDQFRAPFFGRTGVQLWWGAFDLAVLLFSGAQVTAPDDRGYIMRYDLDAQHLNAGFWPGNDAAPQAVFYAYIHPRPDGCATAAIEPPGAGWVEALGQWVLSYDDARRSGDPAAAVLGFLRSAYRVALTIGGWDEAAQRYEAPPPPPRA